MGINCPTDAQRIAHTLCFACLAPPLPLFAQVDVLTNHNLPLSAR